VDSLPARTGVAIVGGGVAGLATAWALAERGVTGELRLLMVRLERPRDGFTWGTREGETVE
jgi:glycine/D-amino acid oxidase-like deaminating enzyme